MISFTDTGQGWVIAHQFPNAEAVGATRKDALHHLVQQPGFKSTGYSGGLLRGTFGGTWWPLYLSDVRDPGFTDVDSETHDAAVAASEFWKNRGSTLFVKVVLRNGTYEVEDVISRVIGFGPTLNAALQDTARRNRRGAYTSNSLIKGTNHEGNPLEEKTISQWAGT